MEKEKINTSLGRLTKLVVGIREMFKCLFYFFDIKLWYNLDNGILHGDKMF